MKIIRKTTCIGIKIYKSGTRQEGYCNYFYCLLEILANKEVWELERKKQLSSFPNNIVIHIRKYKIIYTLLKVLKNFGRDGRWKINLQNQLGNILNISFTIT